MSDEMILLTSLCEALGFSVERKVDIIKGTVKKRFDRIPEWGQVMFPEWEAYEFIGNGQYVEVRRQVRFELTKRSN